MKRSFIKRKRRRTKPGDDPEYLRWVRGQPCVVCDRELSRRFDPDTWVWRNIIDPAHFGRRAIALKPPDSQALPVCRWHHQHAPTAHHHLGSDALFEQAHGINLAELIAEHRARYEEAMAA